MALSRQLVVELVREGNEVRQDTCAGSNPTSATKNANRKFA